MIEKIRKVYYCEFCKKHMFRKSSMENHEKHCTRNVNRDCKMCTHISAVSYLKDVVEKNKNNPLFTGIALDKHDEYETLIESIKLELNSCPVCIMSFAKIVKVHITNFDYKKEVSSFWNDNGNRGDY